jgi:hypothetical protein
MRKLVEKEKERERNRDRQKGRQAGLRGYHVAYELPEVERGFPVF